MIQKRLFTKSKLVRFSEPFEKALAKAAHAREKNGQQFCLTAIAKAVEEVGREQGAKGDWSIIDLISEHDTLLERSPNPESGGTDV